MTNKTMTSRERMLAALSVREPDRVPCSFMLFNGLKSNCSNYAEFIERQVTMGLDAYVQLPTRPPVVVNDHYNLHGLPVSHDARVKIKEWVEPAAAGESPILIKEYLTPAGTLRAEVRKTEDWPWGDHVPFLDDFLVPRSRRFLVNEPADLEALKFLLVAPTSEEITAYRRDAEAGLALARKHGLLTAAGWGVGADLTGWVYGLDRLVYAVFDQPEIVARLLDIIALWNRQRMSVMLDAGVDLFIKRAWYENLDFWNPVSWRKLIYPRLKADVDLAHERGAKFGYIVTSNCMKLLPMVVELGIDVVIGVDPRAWDLAGAKAVLGGKVCLWGGVNGHLTIEQGTPQQTVDEVVEAIRTLAPGGGFILSPVDNVRSYAPEVIKNINALLSRWQDGLA
jgi:hypothetical protein